MIQQVFRSTQTTAARPGTTLHLTFWPEIKQVEMWTEDDSGKRNKVGPSVVFKGQDLDNMLAWLSSYGEKEQL